MTTKNTTQTAPTVTDGVNVSALYETIDAVKQMPQIADFQFRAANRWMGGDRYRSIINGFHGACGDHAHGNGPFVIDNAEGIFDRSRDHAGQVRCRCRNLEIAHSILSGLRHRLEISAGRGHRGRDVISSVSGRAKVRPTRCPVEKPRVGRMTIHMNSVERDADNNRSTTTSPDVKRYARCIEASKRVRWTIDDVIRGRTFDMAQSFLPDDFAKTAEFPTLSVKETRFISQIQGRTYANMFGLLERFVNAMVLELSQDLWFGDQTKLEALVRFSDEEIKHQQLFGRIETMIAAVMPDGYDFTPQPNPVAKLVLSKSTWSVLGLTLMVELVTQAHYRKSIARHENLSPL